jgi:molybdenum cofactor synthesis domain-containing protein
MAKGISAAVVTVSDSRTADDDLSGNKLVELLVSAGAEIVERMIVTDDLLHLRQTLYALAERPEINFIVTTGGTGFGPRDNTPEATRAVIEREAPGLAEAMRRETANKTPMAMLSRGICGIRCNTLIINLPGSPKGVEECFEVIRPVLQHAIDLLAGDTAH